MSQSKSPATSCRAMSLPDDPVHLRV
jgi:hypothetical protein